MSEIGGIPVEILARQLKEGLDEAKVHLYTHKKEHFYRLAYSYVKNHDDAQDLMCDSFEKIFRCIKQLKDDAFLVPWCLRVVITLSINHLRVRRFDRDVTELVRGSYDDNSARLDLQIVMKHIDKLAPGYKSVVELYCLEDLPGKEIAKRLNTHPVTVRSQLHKARQLLKQSMKENYEPIKE